MIRRHGWQVSIIGVGCILSALIGCRPGSPPVESPKEQAVTESLPSQQYHWVDYLEGVRITALAAEGDAMWVGTCASDEGEQEPRDLVRINVVTGEQTMYTAADGLASSCIRDIAIDQEGNKWTCSNGLSRFDGQEWKTYAGGTQPTDEDGMPLYLDREKWKSDAADFPGPEINAVAVDANNRVWCANSGGNGERWGYGVFVLEGQKWRWLTGPQELDLRQCLVEQIVPDREGGVWLELSECAALLHYSEGRWQVHTRPFRGKLFIEGYGEAEHGFSHQGPWCVAVDAEGRVWCGVEYGIVVFDGDKWKSYGPEQGVDGAVWAMTSDSEGRIWAITEEKAVICFEGGKWSKCASLSEFVSYADSIADLAVDAIGRLWVATAEGVKVLEREIPGAD